MFRSNVVPDPLLQLLQPAGLGRFCEQRAVHVLERVVAATTQNDPVVILFPFQYGAWADPEPPPHLRGDGDLTLGRHFGIRDPHGLHITTVMPPPAWSLQPGERVSAQRRLQSPPGWLGFNPGLHSEACSTLGACASGLIA